MIAALRSSTGRITRGVARRIASVACGHLSEAHAEWGMALKAEVEAIESEREALGWAFGGLEMSLRYPSRLNPWLRRREAAALVFAIAAGIAIAYMDSRPNWDDTGITVMALVGAGFVASAVAGRRPWLWALLTGIWVPAVEIPLNGQTPAVAALVFASVGAVLGWIAVQLVSPASEIAPK